MLERSWKVVVPDFSCLKHTLAGRACKHFLKASCESADKSIFESSSVFWHLYTDNWTSWKAQYRLLTYKPEPPPLLSRKGLYKTPSEGMSPRKVMQLFVVYFNVSLCQSRTINISQGRLWTQNWIDESLELKFYRNQPQPENGRTPDSDESGDNPSQGSKEPDSDWMIEWKQVLVPLTTCPLTE